MKKRNIVLAVLGSIAVVVLVGAGVWGFRVATAPIKGQGDAAITKYSAENWTAAQARFEDMHQGIISADEKINTHHAVMVATPEDLTARQTYQGVVSACLSERADYNAEARKYLAEDFMASDLPAQIDKTDPATDCKEN